MYRQHHPDDPGMHHDRLRYTRVTYRHNPSFCDRVRQSLVAVIVGCVLLSVATGLVFWNEGRAVYRARALDEGLSIVLPLTTSDVVFEENNGKLVYLTGSLGTSEPLYDELVSEVMVKAVKLRRTVEMYQWVEHEVIKYEPFTTEREVKEGDAVRTEKTYTYSQDWRSAEVDSDSFYNRFNHKNPKNPDLGIYTKTASDVRIGNIHLSQGLVDSIKEFKHLPVTQLPADKDNMKLHSGGFYTGEDPAYPQIGDVRIGYEYAGLTDTDGLLSEPAVVSVIAKQQGRSLVAYETEDGEHLEFLYMGQLTPAQIFGNEMAQNTLLTWALRFAGWLIMFVGFGCLTRIFVTFVDWIPLVRELVIMGTMTLNAVLSISLSLTVIAVGWIRYRPLLGFTILACALVPFVLTKLRSRHTRHHTPRSFRD